MEFLWIIPGTIVYTLACAFTIHLISDRHNRQQRRARTLYNGREAIYHVRNSE